MTQLERLLTLENVDMLSLLGINDANLKPIEDRFNTTVTVSKPLCGWAGSRP